MPNLCHFPTVTSVFLSYNVLSLGHIFIIILWLPPLPHQPVSAYHYGCCDFLQLHNSPTWAPPVHHNFILYHIHFHLFVYSFVTVLSLIPFHQPQTTLCCSRDYNLTIVLLSFSSFQTNSTSSLPFHFSVSWSFHPHRQWQDIMCITLSLLHLSKCPTHFLLHVFFDL